MLRNDSDADTNDTNYIFLSFVTTYLPAGLVGLLIAIIFLASMGSTASGLNSLASTTAVDVYKRLIKHDGTDSHYLLTSRWATFIWGLFCIGVALYASKLGNLIEAVNILGSLFYGTILGIFVVAFYMKRIGGNAVFYAALIAEALVVAIWWLDLTAFLWLNVIGCAKDGLLPPRCCGRDGSDCWLITLPSNVDRTSRSGFVGSRHEGE
jgi:Na+/proline symporter